MQNEQNGMEQIPFVNVKVRSGRQHRGWYLGKEVDGEKYGGLYGDFDVNIRSFSSNILDAVGLTLNIAALWGIGTKTQVGYGISHIISKKWNIEKATNDIIDLVNVYNSQKENKSKRNKPTLPDLKNFFFVKIKVTDFDNISEGIFKDIRINNEKSKEKLLKIYENYGFYPTAPLIRYWLRSLFRNGDDDLRHFLFGFIAKNVHRNCGGEISRGKCRKCRKKVYKDEIERKPTLTLNNKKFEKMSSKIFVSHVYKLNNHWEFKIWGYIPKVLPNNENRERVLQKLFSEIKENKNFVNVLNLDRNSIEVKWYEVSKVRSDISSVEELIDGVLEVDKDG